MRTSLALASVGVVALLGFAPSAHAQNVRVSVNVGTQTGSNTLEQSFTETINVEDAVDRKSTRLNSSHT